MDRSMRKLDSNQEAMGDQAVNSLGDSNTISSCNFSVGSININQPPVRCCLTKSLIYKLLKKMLRSKRDCSDDFSLKPPDGLNEKLVYNDALRYRNIIEEYADSYMQLAEVLNDFPDSETVIRKVRLMFLGCVCMNPDGTPKAENGDAVLESIRKEIWTTVTNDADFDSDEVPVEAIDEFCIALIAVAVEKCKVLLPPGDGNALA